MKWALVKTEVVRDETAKPFVRNTYVEDHMATRNACQPTEKKLILVQSLDEQPPTLLSTLTLEEPVPEKMTWNKRFFGDCFLSADTITDVRGLREVLKAHGLSLSADCIDQLAEFFDSECEQ